MIGLKLYQMIDEIEMPEKKAVQIGEFKIGMIHGHQIIPWGDETALDNVQRELGCDILLWGHSHQIEVKARDGKFFINPGSISGAFSYNSPDPTPSFVLMVLQGEEAIVYMYCLNDKKMKFDVNKLEFSKASGEFKKVEEEEEAEENPEASKEENKVEA